MDPIASLAEHPERSAIVLDIDGTLAPIVPRPEDAWVPETTRAVLEQIAERYRLLAFLTGRTMSDAERVVGVQQARYVGLHGLELEPGAERWRPALLELAAQVGWPAEDVEDKELIVVFHYRSARDEAAARARLEDVAKLARDNGLVPHFGRKVLEIRPPVRADKGTALRRLLAEAQVTRALYAGDDTTDLDAFRALGEAGLDVAVRVAIDSAEAPDGLREQADVVLDGPAALVALLDQL